MTDLSAAAAALVAGLLQRYPQSRRWVIAYSGGLDSHVLLHLIAKTLSGRRPPVPELSALHVNHGIHEDVDTWQAHCEAVCAGLGVAIRSERVQVEPGRRRGLERAAREARYAAFTAALQPGDLLLQAHHLDDQAETVLLRLLRGSGPGGLAGIPMRRPLDQASIERPLLQYSREQLQRYAIAEGLQWIDDPGNRSEEQDRNFLRHRAMPMLQRQWPDVAARLARSAESCRQAVDRQLQIARSDLRGRCGRDRFEQDFLELDGLDALEPQRQRNLLRQWLRDIARFAPSRAQLDRLNEDLLQARDDAMPRLQVAQVDLRRFRNRLYRVTGSGSAAAPEVSPLPGIGTVELGEAGRLHVTTASGGGLLPGENMEVRFRSGGIKCRLVGNAVSRSLKRQLQQLGVPPWLRGRIPLVYVDGRLAAIGDLAICEGSQAGPGQEGLNLRWEYPLELIS